MTEEQFEQSILPENYENAVIAKELFKKMKLKLLVLIVDREKVKHTTKVLQEQHVRIHFVCMATGTAKSELLDLLGIGSTDNALIFCVEPDYRIRYLIPVLSEKLLIHKAGHGIVFTVPLSGITGPFLKLLDNDVKENLEKKMEKEIEKIKTEAKYDLIIAVTNQGYSDELMDAAREAGARGGTILHARRINEEDVVKFLGISVHSEKEIIALLVTKENKHNIMKAITKACGIKTEAKGLVFSIPVEDAEGLNS